MWYYIEKSIVYEVLNMDFSERLRALRKKAGLTQTELAEAAGSTMRSIQNYEAGKRYPQNIEIAKKLAAALGVTSGELLGEEGEIIVDAGERGGQVSARELRGLVENLSCLFAGGELTDDDRDAAMQAISEAYWIAKKNAKKYSNKK